MHINVPSMEEEPDTPAKQEKDRPEESRPDNCPKRNDGEIDRCVHKEVVAEVFLLF